MLKPFVSAKYILPLIIILIAYFGRCEAAKQKRMIIGFSGSGNIGAVNGNIKQNGELPSNAEINAAIQQAKMRLALHQEKKGNSKGTGVQLAAGKVSLRR